MSFKKTLFAVAAFAFVGAASAAPNPATATFQVLLKIQKSCAVTAGTASNIDLGTVDASATNLAGNNTISVNCANKTPYFIGLAPSNANTLGAGTLGPLNIAPVTGNTDVVPYQLRSATGVAGAIWGNTATGTVVGNGVSGTGNGSAQSITVYATVPSANFTADSYRDTVTVNVNY